MSLAGLASSTYGDILEAGVISQHLTHVHNEYMEPDTLQTNIYMPELRFCSEHMQLQRNSYIFQHLGN